ncbi:hydrolase [Tepidibacter hydrothermalis]|uniref:Hydrolase n=1 Tax=Tepidibacter hydrothermalis TaxID=3036126 RepID=A0ABY8EGY8_9FIRM|nr:hydrolase [Tepidibacter hydrothermalis]WFD12204.1 hydrolase [Tepidibacter hydrothermalis]
MEVEILIQNGNKVYIPVVEEDIVWSTERKDIPGQLTFNIIPDEIINFTEGNAVRMKVDGKNIFYGFIFTKKRTKEGIISVTAYDQLRYLKNKDTYVYTNKTAGEFIQMIASDFNLQTGTLEDTGYKIASRVEDNVTLMEMIQSSLDLTLQAKKELYVLYDDFGKIALKNIMSMQLNILIDEETGENYSYSSSIDSDTYNKIKLVYDNEESGKRDVYIAQDSTNMNSWGVLQYFDTLQKGENGKAKADALLSLYNSKTRNLVINNAFGDTRVRAGSMVIVQLNLGDIKLNNFMLVEKCKHKFKNDEHLMDLTLRGGEFVA